MEQTKFNFISDLDVCKDDFILKVRVIRAWRKPMYNNASVTHTIEMIMVDEQDYKQIIDCSVDPNLSIVIIEQTKFNFISDLDVCKDDFILKVRVIRAWRKPMYNNVSVTHTIEMIIVDEQSKCLFKLFDKFEQFIVEGNVLLIKKHSLGTVHGFHFQDYRQIVDCSVDPNLSIVIMEQTKFNFIGDLDVCKDDFILILRVIRAWRKPMYNNAFGDRIQSNCLFKLFDKFEQFFVEGNVLLIKKPSLGENVGRWRNINNPLKVCMERKTEVRQINEWSGTVHGFHFQDYSELKVLSCSASLLIMEQTKFNFISDLDVCKDDFILKVRVIRAWRKPMYNNASVTHTIEIIMVDEHGDRIQSNCLFKLFDKFEQFFVEGNVLLIKKPSLRENVGRWRNINNPLKVCMERKTEVRQINEWSGTVHGFQFQDYRQIVDCCVDPNFSIDIIGMIVKCNPVVAWGKNPDNNDKIRLNIRGKRIWITLFVEYAENLIQYLSNHKDESDVVIVLQFAKFAVYKGDHSITNAFRGTKLFINNEEVDEISSFKKSYIESHGHGSTSLFIGLSSAVSYSLEKDFLVHTEFNHIADLNVVSEVKKVVILGTIKCLQEGSKWFWYFCDTCNRMIDKKLNKEAIGTSGDLWTYFCNTKDCQGTTIKATARFKLLIKVQDSTGVCTLTLFDREARKLLNSTSTEMIRRYVDVKPSEIDNLFEKRFAMKIDVKEYNIDNDYRFFTISKVTDDAKIIKSFDDKHNIEQSSFSGSVNFSSQDFRSQDNSFNKEPIAVTDDAVSTVLLAADVSADSSGPVEAVAEHGSADTMLAAAVPVVDLVAADGVELSHGDKVDDDGAEIVKAHLVVVKREVVFLYLLLIL
ncbi:hypothetical protein SSX86_003332 [Deinandra increscens subsp. villosa]|uniref:Replication protein A 70 kDa DNA-binding subunit B/D first OB fold domain-containing protein n=1 Tax=Deinandra increscens subsp. villosa TaxID=3103831 RepID=A0AAP0H4X4_9ASTR